MRAVLSLVLALSLYGGSLGASVPEPWRRGEVRMRVALARALSAEGEHRMALGHLKEALALDPNGWPILLEKAICQIHMGRFDEGVEGDLLGVLKVSPKSLQGRYHLALVFQEQDRLEDALGVLQELVREKPSWIEGRMRLAEVLLDMRRPKRAIEHLRAILDLLPGDVMARSRLATAYEASGSIYLAEVELKALLALVPSNPYPYEALAAFYERQGAPDKAQAAREVAKGRMPHRAAREYRKLRPFMGKSAP